MSTIIESKLTKTQIVTELCRSPHEGKKDPKQKLTNWEKLSKYIPVTAEAVRTEEEFVAHLIAWNRAKGQVMDSKIAIPVLALNGTTEDFRDNALAHLALLDPRSLVRAVEYAREAKVAGRRSRIRMLMTRYLQNLESNMGRWERTFIQHRKSIYTLYGWSRLKASPRAGALLRGEYPEGSTLSVIRKLHDLPSAEAGRLIVERQIPFLVARAAMGKRMKETDVLMAIIERMSPTELTSNMKTLEKLGVKDVPELRATLEKALTKASTSSKNILKTSVAVDAIEDEGLKEKLKGLQERQIDKQIGIDGDWLVLADKSGSMQESIEASRHIAAALARFVKGRVDLVFFDTSPRALAVTGESYDKIREATKFVSADGGTSIGCGLDWALQNSIAYGGIVIISDGGENNFPAFSDIYPRYVKSLDCEPTVYFYRLRGERNVFSDRCAGAKIQLQEFDLTSGPMDYVALPNLVQTMRTNRYSLADEIMAVPLLTLDSVLGTRKE